MNRSKSNHRLRILLLTFFHLLLLPSYMYAQDSLSLTDPSTVSNQEMATQAPLPQPTTKWWYYLIGYSFSVIGGQLIYLLSDTLFTGMARGSEDVKGKIRPYPEHPQMIGVLERFLYTASWQFGKPEFIGLWLAVKVAGQWKGWAEAKEFGKHPLEVRPAEENDEIPVLGRAIYNVFLIGSGFSIAYGVIGGLVIGWLKEANTTAAVVTPILLIVGTFLFWLWACIATKHHSNARKKDIQNRIEH